MLPLQVHICDGFLLVQLGSVLAFHCVAAVVHFRFFSCVDTGGHLSGVVLIQVRALVIFMLY